MLQGDTVHAVLQQKVYDPPLPDVPGPPSTGQPGKARRPCKEDEKEMNLWMFFREEKVTPVRQGGSSRDDDN
ncbi:hypothetical protein VTO42DRAFT_7985 [Malbranchea cinnamomea]